MVGESGDCDTLHLIHQVFMTPMELAMLRALSSPKAYFLGLNETEHLMPPNSALPSNVTMAASIYRATLNGHAKQTILIGFVHRSHWWRPPLPEERKLKRNIPTLQARSLRQALLEKPGTTGLTGCRGSLLARGSASAGVSRGPAGIDPGNFRRDRNSLLLSPSAESASLTDCSLP